MKRSVLTAMLVVLATPALADVTIGVGITVPGDAEIKNTVYGCAGHEPLTVQYLNAAPNFLALVPIDGKTLIFVTTVSAASGAKYVSGQYIWWDKGTDATLSDVTEGLDAAPVLMCTEQNDTP